jgi:hypothetical protein
MKQASGLFTAIPSATPIWATTSQQIKSYWKTDDISAPFENTPPFYQKLLNHPLPEIQCQEIASEVNQKALVACSDGAHDPSTSIVSQGVGFFEQSPGGIYSNSTRPS